MFRVYGVSGGQHRLTTTCLLALLLPAIAAHGDFSIRTVAVSGSPAPGTELTTAFSGFYNAVVNRDGGVAFFGSLSGPDIVGTNAEGIWAERGGMIELVVRADDPAPGPVPGSIFHRFEYFQYDDQGNVMFHAVFRQPAQLPWPRSIWINRNGVTTLLARTGDPCVGVSGYVYDNYFLPMLLRDGIGYLYASTDTSPVGGGAGVWRTDGGPVSLVGHSGDPMPGIINGSLNGIGSVMLSEHQIVTLFGSSNVPSETPQYRAAIWSDRDGDLTLLLDGTDTPPGFDPAISFNLMGRPSVNRDGRLVFSTHLAGPGITEDNDQTIWTDVDGELDLVMREGDVAPCVDGGRRFCQVYAVAINDSGTIILRADSSLDCDSVDRVTGIWAANDGDLDCVMLSQQAVPDEAPGVVFKGAGATFVNNLGQIFFEGYVSGPGIDLTNDRGIWVVQPDGEIERVFRTGTLFDVDDDPLVEDLRTIDTYYISTSSNTSEGRSTSVNDRGEVAFVLRFTDASSGAFVARTLPIESCTTPGDLNADSLIDGRDIAGFVDCVILQGGIGCACADVDGNAVVDLADLSSFSAALLSQS